jgi:hypothetical protein
METKYVATPTRLVVRRRKDGLVVGETVVDAETLRPALTDLRLDVLRLIRETPGTTVSSLSRHTGRATGRIGEDVAILAALGLVQGAPAGRRHVPSPLTADNDAFEIAEVVALIGVEDYPHEGGASAVEYPAAESDATREPSEAVVGMLESLLDNNGGKA